MCEEVTEGLPKEGFAEGIELLTLVREDGAWKVSGIYVE